MALATKTRRTTNPKAQITLDDRYKSLFINAVEKQDSYSIASLVRDAFDYAQGRESRLIRFSETQKPIPFTDPRKEGAMVSHYSVAVGAETWNSLTEWTDRYFSGISRYSLYTEMVFFYLMDHNLL